MKHHPITRLFCLLLLTSTVLLSACEREPVGVFGPIYPKAGDAVDPANPVFRWESDDPGPVTFRLGTAGMREKLIDTENRKGEFRLDGNLTPGCTYTVELAHGDKLLNYDFQAKSIPLLFLGSQPVELTYYTSVQSAITVETAVHFVQSLSHLLLEFEDRPGMPPIQPRFRVGFGQLGDPLQAENGGQLWASATVDGYKMDVEFDLERMTFEGSCYLVSPNWENWTFRSL